MNARTLYALASLLLLVQVPHVLNLPVWVSVTGLVLVAGRLMLLKYPANRLLRITLAPLSVTAMAAFSALLIKWDFGYFLGRDPCVAFLFILVAAKFAEVRRDRDATSLLCLCAFLLLTHYFYSQSIIAALISLPAVLALSYCLAILRDADNPETTGSQLRLIGALLLQGLPLAAVLFLAFPRLPGPLWSLPEDAMGTTGLSDSMSPGSIGELSLSAAVAFRVEFEDEVPPSEQLYWRGPVLSGFNGRDWTVSGRQYKATPQYEGPADQLLHYTVTLQPHRQRWLFALDSATSLPRADSAAAGNGQPIGDMLADWQITARENVSQVLRYRQTSILSDTVPRTIAPRADTLYLPGVNRRSIEFAREQRALHNSDSDYAFSMLRHFGQDPFSYTLRPQTLGDTPVDEFLFDTREGFCEHYAAAFVVLMRAAGIPARVVTGYQGGTMNGDYMIVRQSDAHAWAEAFINGVWQRFDPTSAVAPSRVQQGLAAALPFESSVPRLARNTPGFIHRAQLRWDALNHHWQRLVIDFDNDTQAGLWQRMGLELPPLWLISLGVIALAGLWSALVLGLPRTGKRGYRREEDYWQRLSALLHARHLVRLPVESQGEYLGRAARRWPSQRNRLEQLDEAFDRLRFRQLTAGQRQQLLQQTRRQLLHLRWGLLSSGWLKSPSTQEARR